MYISTIIGSAVHISTNMIYCHPLVLRQCLHKWWHPVGGLLLLIMVGCTSIGYPMRKKFYICQLTCTFSSNICSSNIGPNCIYRSLHISIKISIIDICDLLFLSNCLNYRVYISFMTDKIKSIHEISTISVPCWHRDVNPLWPGNTIWHDTYQSSWHISDFVLCQYAIRPLKHFHQFFYSKYKHFHSHPCNHIFFKIHFHAQLYFSRGKWLEQTLTAVMTVYLVAVCIGCPVLANHSLPCQYAAWRTLIRSGQPSGLLTAWSLKYNTFTSLTHWPLGDVVEILLKIRFHVVMTVYLFTICIDCPVFANLDSYTNLAMWQ